MKEKATDDLEYVPFTLAQIPCEAGGWAVDTSPPSPEQIAAAEDRWAMRSYRDDSTDTDDWISHQCGGCRFFAAAGADYGVCWNEKSPLDGCVTFEHGGCVEHSERDRCLAAEAAGRKIAKALRLTEKQVLVLWRLSMGDEPSKQSRQTLRALRKRKLVNKDGYLTAKGRKTAEALS